MSAAVEIIAAGEYTRHDFDNDRRVVEEVAHARDALIERVRTWDVECSLDLARRLVRMRASDHWRGPGMKGNDAEFCDWLVGKEIIGSPRYARALLMSGRAVAVLERTDDVKTAGTIAHFPVGANQTRALGSSWYLDRPDALVNVWIAATEEANGQPSAELVASKARRYKADVRSVEDDRQESADARLVGRKLRRIRRELIELWRREPGQVESFLRELSVSIRQEGRAWRTPEGER